MIRKTKKYGQAGIIMIMLIFGLLMTVSTAYMKMVQTEVDILGMVDHSDRAADAAFSGINYAIALAQKNRSMFDEISGMAAVASRTYITSFANSNWSPVQIPSGVTWDNAKVKTLVASVPSDWIFLNETLDNYLIDSQIASPPYFFRVTSYPATSTTSVATTAVLLIKSQGRYYQYSDASKTSIIATFSAQLIAECKVVFKRKILQLNRYRYMPFQSDTDFFKYSPY
ncbi:MAG TPA: hypothetical protein PKC25_06640 [Candidatus Rifleibacterium sp.]|nr:hypothetical protein [Candidatus Rifleibacterium sp.]